MRVCVVLAVGGGRGRGEQRAFFSGDVILRMSNNTTISLNPEVLVKVRGGGGDEREEVMV